MSKSERAWLKCKNGNKRVLKHAFIDKRKLFDRCVQRAKRSYISKAQSEVDELITSNPNEFWKEIGKIGIGSDRLKKIPFEVNMPDGSVSCNPQVVLTKWAEDFSGLLNTNVSDEEVTEVEGQAEDAIYGEGNDALNECITLEETLKALVKAKSGKAPGFDNIPIDLLKNNTALYMLFNLFNQCFKAGRVPDAWSKGVISPIPKSSTADPRNPLSYRGLTLAPSMYKVYASIINDRISKWCMAEGVLNDEQNGFVKGKSTIDHVYSLNSIIETRKLKKQSTFTAFVDFKKTYDYISRNILWEKLKKLWSSW